MPSAALTLDVAGLNASSLAAPQLWALTLALAAAMRLPNGTLAVSGISAAASGTSLGVVISGDSDADVSLLVDDLLLLLPSTAPSGTLVAALNAADAAFASITSVSMAGSVAFGDAAPLASVGATLLLRGGVNATLLGAAEQAAFVVALANVLNVTVGEVDAAAPSNLPGGGVMWPITVDASSAAQAVQLAAQLAAALPSNASTSAPALWQAVAAAGIAGVTSVEALGAPVAQAPSPTGGTAPVMACTLMLTGVNPAASFGDAESAALSEALADALGISPEAIKLTGLGDDGSGNTLVGVAVFADSAAAAAALAATLANLLPQTPVSSALATSLTNVTINLANLTAVSAPGGAPVVGDAAPSASMAATLVLSGAGLSAASFGATQQAAFAAALSTYLDLSGGALALTAVEDAPGNNSGVAVTFAVGASGDLQATGVAATLAAAVPSSATAASADLWAAISSAGLPQVTGVDALGTPASLVAAAAGGGVPVAATTLQLAGVAASAFGVGEEAALSAVLADALGCSAEAVTITGAADATGGLRVGVVVSADSTADAAALATALGALLPSAAPAGLLASNLAASAQNLGSVTAVSAPAPVVGDAAPSASMAATLLLSGAGLTAASFGATQQAVFAAALSAFLGVSGGTLALTDVQDAGAGMAVAVTVATAGAVRAASLAAALAAAVPSSTANATALWAAISNAGLPQVAGVDVATQPAAQVAPASDVGAPVATTTLLLSGVNASAISAADQAALTAALAFALSCAPDAVIVSGVAAAAGGALVGLLVIGTDAADAAGLATAMDALLPSSPSAPSALLASAVAQAALSFATLTNVSALGGSTLVGDAAPSSSVSATLSLLGAGLSGATFSAAQQAAFAAALSSFLDVGAGELVLTDVQSVAGGVTVSFSVAAAGGLQAAVLAAALTTAVPSSGSGLPALWQAVSNAGMPQVTSVTAPVAPTIVGPSVPATATSVGIALQSFPDTDAFGVPQQAAFLAAMTALLGASAGDVTLVDFMAGAPPDTVLLLISVSNVPSPVVANLTSTLVLAALQESGLPQVTAVQVPVSAPPPPSPPPSPPPPPPPSPLPPARSALITQAIDTPTVSGAIVLYGPTLVNGVVNATALAAISQALADSVGTDVSLVSITTVEWVVQSVFFLYGATNAAPTNASYASSGAALAASIDALTGASAAQTTLEVLSTVTTTSRRLLAGALEVIILAANPTLAAVQYFTTALTTSLNDTSLLAALKASGVNASSLTLSVGYSTGLQFGFLIECPDGVAGIPNGTAVQAAVNQGGLDTDPAFFADANAAGLGNIDAVVVSLLPILGACVAVTLALLHALMHPNGARSLPVAAAPEPPIAAAAITASVAVPASAVSAAGGAEGGHLFGRRQAVCAGDAGLGAERHLLHAGRADELLRRSAGGDHRNAHVYRLQCRAGGPPADAAGAAAADPASWQRDQQHEQHQHDERGQHDQHVGRQPRAGVLPAAARAGGVGARHFAERNA
jgi:hypothetical protein